MKKILFMLILLIPFIVYAEYDESKITIESFGMSSHEGNGSENATAVINGKNVNFNYEVSDVGDKITFDMVIKNESGEDIEVYNRLDKSNYIDYMLISPDLDYVVKNNSTKTFQLVVEYVNQVDEALLASGSIRDDKTYKLEVSNEIGRNADALGIDDVTHDAVDPTPTSVPATVDNPKTLSVKNILAIVCIIFVISIGLFLIIRRKNRLGKLFVIVGLLGIITPIVVYAYKEFNISLKATVLIKKPKEEPVVEPVYICKRATVLHQEECTTTSYFSCNSLGYAVDGSKGTTTIVYGNLGTNGTLKAGDAFDCDVNGDGIYSAETERFYYVGTSGDYANLIFYTNTVNGERDSTTTVAYYKSGYNWYGPIDGIKHLPKTTQWSNIQLDNYERNIVNEDGGKTTSGGTLPTTFSYEGYAARMITTQEVESACNLAPHDSTYFSLNTCDYLLENTKFTNTNNTEGYWLENPIRKHDKGVFSLSGYVAYVWGHNTGMAYANNNISNGVRPVIEVPLDNIEY